MIHKFIEQIRAHTRWSDALIPFGKLVGDRELRKARLLVLFYLTTAVFLATFAAFYAYIGYYWGVAATLYGATIVPILLLVFRKTGSFQTTTRVFDFNAILMFAALIYGSGGGNSPIVPWLAIVPATGYVFAGWRRGLFMSAICLLEILAWDLLQGYGIQMPMLYNLEQTQVLNTAVQAGLLAYISIILLVYEGSSARTIRLLDRLNADLVLRKQEVEEQREALAERNARIAEINANLELMVASRTQKLEQARHELDTFLYEAAHALRRPLASIVGLLDIARSETDPAITAKMHANIDISLTQMEQLLGKLILVSDLNARTPSPDATSLAAALDSACNSYAAPIEAMGSHFVVDVDADLQVMADPYMLQFVLAPILDNALQYTAKTGRAPSIQISARANDDGQVQLQVQDNGLGVGATEVPRLTEMFFRATAKVQGSGLGLYIAQKALDFIGGSMQIDSELGVGTLVKVQLPGVVRAQG